MKNPEPWKQKIEGVIAEVVNATGPSNDQMKTVRLLRQLLPNLLAENTKEVEERIAETARNLIKMNDPYNSRGDDRGMEYNRGLNDLLSTITHQEQES